MRVLNLALNGVTALAATIFIAYFGLRTNAGFLASLPDSISGVFIQNDGLQFVALAVVVVALLLKVPLANALKHRKTESQM